MKNQIDLCRAYLRSASGVESVPDAGVKSPGPVVTISRQAGARGNSIAVALVEILQKNRNIPCRHQWTLFNQNLIQHVINEHSLPQSAADYLTEDGGGDVSTMIAEMLGLHPGVYNTVRSTAESIRRIARAGGAVIVGRGGNIITADIFHSVHVRLVGSEKTRVRHYAEYMDISEDQAAGEVARSDRARKRYLKSHYDANIDDSRHYDLTINTDRFSNEDAAGIIVRALASRFG